MTSFIRGVGIPALLITAIIVIPLCASWELDMERKEAPIRHEIAENFASSKWNRCDLAMKWDPSVLCPAHSPDR